MTTPLRYPEVGEVMAITFSGGITSGSGV